MILIGVAKVSRETMKPPPLCKACFRIRQMLMSGQARLLPSIRTACGWCISMGVMSPTAAAMTFIGFQKHWQR